MQLFNPGRRVGRGRGRGNGNGGGVQEWVWVCVKIGDQIVGTGNEHLAMRDGFIVDYIDPNDPNYGEDWVPSEWSRTVFLYVKVPYARLSQIQDWVKDSGRPTDKNNYLLRKKRINFGNMPAAVQNKIRDPRDSVKLLDATEPEMAWVRPDRTRNRISGWSKSDYEATEEDTEPIPPGGGGGGRAFDFNAINSGSYTIGSDPGDDYATVAAFTADLAILTGDITGTVTSDTTETGGNTIGINKQGHTLTYTSDTDPGGDVTSGHLTTCNFNGLFIYDASVGGGTVVVEKLHAKRTSSGIPGNDMFTFAATAGSTSCCCNLMLDGNGYKGNGIRVASANPTVDIYNCYIWDFDDAGYAGIFVDEDATCTIENNTIYDCNIGIDGDNHATPTYRNTVCHNNSTDWSGIGNATGNNCAQTGAGAIGFSTENNTVSSVADSDFSSVTDTDADFLNIGSGSDLADAGSTGTLADTSINGEDRNTSGSDWDIGAYEAAVSSAGGGSFARYVNTLLYDCVEKRQII